MPIDWQFDCSLARTCRPPFSHFRPAIQKLHVSMDRLESRADDDALRRRFRHLGQTMQRDELKPLRLTRWLRSRARRSTSFSLLAFLLAVAVAPHHHLNSFADLLSEGRSDSGTFIDAGLSDAPGEARIRSARLVSDDPCLACFHRDYAAAPSTTFVVDRTLTPHLEVPASARRSVPEPASESPASRSPPRDL